MRQPLGHVGGEHESGDDEDAAADAEQSGQEAGEQPDDGDRQQTEPRRFEWSMTAVVLTVI